MSLITTVLTPSIRFVWCVTRRCSMRFSRPSEPRYTNTVPGLSGKYGFATGLAATGVAGVWVAQEHAYGAIVLDILLAVMNGYKVCARLRAAGVWRPFLMLTAKDGAFDEGEALVTGADDYVTKPFSYA